MTRPPGKGEEFGTDEGLDRQQSMIRVHSDSEGNSSNGAMKMGDKTPRAPNVSSYYDRFMYDEVISNYFDHSDYYNFGMWRDTTAAPKDACRALMAELVALAPPHPARVLEVGCGKGATTRELRAHWPEAEITAIDVSEIQLETCRRNCPDASFMLMNACEMTFEDSSFDIVISVEAAFHFPSRRAFLEHTRRVLAPSGRVVLQDVLYVRQDAAINRPRASQNVLDPSALLPPENHLEGPEAYESLLREVGFERARIVDVTADGPRRFYEHLLAHLTDRKTWKGYDPDHIRRLRIGARLFARQLKYCVLVSAHAPG
jgi:MPBQ/MSBQ methyltransferase